jgi:hypothetical protein
LNDQLIGLNIRQTEATHNDIVFVRILQNWRAAEKLSEIKEAGYKRGLSSRFPRIAKEAVITQKWNCHTELLR